MGANEPGQPPRGASGYVTRNLPTPASALAVGAHPDDVEFGAGGTLAKWAAAGCVIHHLVCTDGSKGTWNPDTDIAALVITREAEQRVAARRLAAGASSAAPVGGGSVMFLGQVDGELDPSPAAVGEVARVIRTVRPDIVLGHDPWKRYRLHPDHRAAGFLVCDAVVAARDPHFFREHRLEPHRPASLLLWEADEPDHVEDVTDTVDVKLAALEAHTSQFESTMHAASDAELDAFRAQIRVRLTELGAPFDMPAAEVFKLITDL
jgi:LmbE family N-acetylglucosaminyl deacetylase